MEAAEGVHIRLYAHIISASDSHVSCSSIATRYHREARQWNLWHLGCCARKRASVFNLLAPRRRVLV